MERDHNTNPAAQDITLSARVNTTRLVRLLAWIAIAYGFYGVYSAQYLNMPTGLRDIVEHYIRTITHGHARGTAELVYGGCHLAAGLALILGGLLVFRRERVGWSLLRAGSLVLLITLSLAVWHEVELNSTFYDGRLTQIYRELLWRNLVWRSPTLLARLMFCLIVWLVISPRKRASPAGFAVVPPVAPNGAS
jgi:hypothetical protein